jgi:hypothetical protein
MVSHFASDSRSSATFLTLGFLSRAVHTKHKKQTFSNNDKALSTVCKQAHLPIIVINLLLINFYFWLVSYLRYTTLTADTLT